MSLKVCYQQQNAQTRTFPHIFFFSKYIKMDMGNLFKREIRQLEDEVMKQKQIYRDRFPNGILEVKAYEGFSGIDAIPLEQILETEDKFFAIALSKLKARYEKLEGKTHYWIGINPPPDSLTMLELYEKMEKLVKKNKFFQEGYIYCLENYTKAGERPHVHMMLTTKTKPHRIIETLAEYFDIKRNFIDLTKYRHDILFNQHVKYIKGDKIEEKAAYVLKDKELLEDLGIPKYLGNLFNLKTT